MNVLFGEYPGSAAAQKHAFLTIFSTSCHLESFPRLFLVFLVRFSHFVISHLIVSYLLICLYSLRMFTVSFVCTQVILCWWLWATAMPIVCLKPPVMFPFHPQSTSTTTWLQERPLTKCPSRIHHTGMMPRKKVRNTFS